MPPRSWSLFGGDYRRLVRVFFAGALLVVGEEGGQRLGLLSGIAVRCVGGFGLLRAQRLGEPARAFQQPFGFLRHLRLFQMIDELRRRLALGLAHRLEDAGLGDPAEIIVDRRPPSGFDHVQSDSAREAVGLYEPALDAMDGHARTAIAVALLVERIDAE